MQASCCTRCHHSIRAWQRRASPSQTLTKSLPARGTGNAGEGLHDSAYLSGEQDLLQHFRLRVSIICLQRSRLRLCCCCHLCRILIIFFVITDCICLHLLHILLSPVLFAFGL